VQPPHMNAQLDLESMAGRHLELHRTTLPQLALVVSVDSPIHLDANRVTRTRARMASNKAASPEPVKTP
jgi:hypothetical protein